MDQAERDLEHARADMEQGFYEWACFSSQQAAEKAFEAVFQKMGAEAWEYSVADLLDELRRSHEVPEELVNGALELDKACIPTGIRMLIHLAPKKAIHARGGRGS